MIIFAFLKKTDLIQVHDKEFELFISAQTIQQRVSEMARQLAEDLGDVKPLFVGILNGSFMFAADFLKYYPLPCELSFIKLASYKGTQSTGQVKEVIGLDQNPDKRVIVILEDIVDTGNTLEEIHRIFSNNHPQRLIIATLFFKPTAFRKNLPIEYAGFEIPNKFILGYGLDYDGLGRNLPDVYQLKDLSSTDKSAK